MNKTLARVIALGGLVVAAAGTIGLTVYLMNKNSEELQKRCVAVVSKVDTLEGRTAAEIICSDPCMYGSVNELVSKYHLTDAQQIYNVALKKCNGGN